jgi:hypothetical protein
LTLGGAFTPRLEKRGLAPSNGSIAIKRLVKIIFLKSAFPLNLFPGLGIQLMRATSVLFKPEKVPSFENSTVAVFPTSLHFPQSIENLFSSGWSKMPGCKAPASFSLPFRQAILRVASRRIRSDACHAGELLFLENRVLLSLSQKPLSCGLFSRSLCGFQPAIRFIRQNAFLPVGLLPDSKKVITL